MRYHVTWKNEEYLGYGSMEIRVLSVIHLTPSKTFWLLKDVVPIFSILPLCLCLPGQTIPRLLFISMTWQCTKKPQAHWKQGLCCAFADAENNDPLPCIHVRAFVVHYRERRQWPSALIQCPKLPSQSLKVGCGPTIKSYIQNHSKQIHHVQKYIPPLPQLWTHCQLHSHELLGVH